jgi:M6 family metalloprotease-like protein
MHTRLVAGSALLAVTLFSSCAGTAESTVDEAIVEATTTNLAPPTLSETYSDTPQSQLAEADECHIVNLDVKNNDGPTDALVGFPRPRDTFPILKPRILVLPFWFSDGAPPDAIVGPTVRGIEAASHYFEQVSWGKAALTVEAAPKDLWLAIPKTAAEMKFTKDTPRDRHVEHWIRSLLDFTTPQHRLDEYDVIVLTGLPSLLNWLAAKSETDSKWGPYEAPGGVVRGAILMTEAHGQSSTMAHELAHAWLNLLDQYAMIGGVEDFVGMNRFGILSIIGNNEFSAIEMETWSKYLSGWIEPNQMRCVTNPGSTTHFITPNATPSDLPKMIGVRISETKVLVIDTWRKSEFNMCCNETIAYVIDSSRVEGAGQYRLQGAMELVGDTLALDASHLSTTSKWTLRPNENLTISNVSITLLESDESGALVEVTVS